MKKLISVILSITMLFSLITLSLVSVSAATSGNYTYTVSDGYATINDVKTSISGHVDIPSVLGGYPVSKIAMSAFEDCSKITSVSIPDSITTIAMYAFYGCDNLTDVYYSSYRNRMENISISIYNTGLSQATWHYVVEDYLAYSYDEEKLTATLTDCEESVVDVVVPESVVKNGKTYIVTQINSNIFSGNSIIKSVTLPVNLKSILSYAFSDCSALTDVYYQGSYRNMTEGLDIFSYNDSLENATWHFAVEDYLAYSYDEEKLTATLTNCEESVVDVVVPDSVVKNGKTYIVTKINSNVFSGNSIIKSITLPVNLKSILSYAFSDCSALTDVYYQGSYRNMTEDLDIFSHNDSLKNATWHYAVDDCLQYSYDDDYTAIVISCIKDVTEVTIPEKIYKNGHYYVVDRIEYSSFSGCSLLKSITIPVSIKNVYSYAFSDCSALTDVYYKGSFKDKKENLSIFNYNTPLENAAWHYAKEEYLAFDYNENNLTAGVMCCYNSVENIIIPETVEKDGVTYSVNIIYGGAFDGCTTLNSVTIPSTVKTIYSGAFDESSSLKTVYFLGTEEQKKTISIGSYNQILDEATWYYEACFGAAEHTYDGVCDPQCNGCGLERDVPEHSFDANGKCELCGYISYTVGDIDNNSDVNTSDLAVIKLFLSGTNQLDEIGLLAGDLNGDGAVNTTDLASLKLMLAGIV